MNATETRTDPAAETRRDADEQARLQVQEIEALCCCAQWLMDDAREGNMLSREAREILRELGWKGSEFDDALEAIEQRARELPLSAELAGSWDVGSEPKADELRILLCTGGPAVRVVYRLDRYGQPRSPRLESQGWFIPWAEVDITSDQDDALCWLGQLLYAGEE